MLSNSQRAQEGELTAGSVVWKQADLSDRSWADLAEKGVGSTMFHRGDWLSLEERVWNLKSAHMIALVDSKPAAIFPLFISGRMLLSPAIFDYGGIAFSAQIPDRKKETLVTLGHAALEKAQNRHRCSLLYVRPHYNNYVHSTFCRDSGRTVAQHIAIDLQPHPDGDPLKHLDKKKRNSIRTALRGSLQFSEVDLTESNDLEVYLENHSKSKRNHGARPFPRKFFEALAEMPKGTVMVGMVYNANSPVAGILGLAGSSVLHVFDAWTKSHPLRGAGDLAYFNLIQHAWNLGLTVDFGRTSAGVPGLLHYKLQFGGAHHEFGTYRTFLGGRLRGYLALASNHMRWSSH